MADAGSLLVETLRFVMRSEPWRAKAKCLEEGISVDAFFPYRGSSQKQAKAACARCPVQDECRDFARRSGSEYGIWGGEIMRRGSTPDEEPDERIGRLLEFVAFFVEAVEAGHLTVPPAAVDHAHELLAEWAEAA